LYDARGFIEIGFDRRIFAAFAHPAQLIGVLLHVVWNEIPFDVIGSKKGRERNASREQKKNRSRVLRRTAIDRPYRSTRLTVRQ